MERVAGEPRTNKERAIYYYELALQIATRDALPEQYAILQTMLGRAYANRVEGERKDNLKPGCLCYSLALEIDARDTSSQEYARTQFLVGEVYDEEITRLDNYSIL